MKKLIVLLFTFLFACLMTGCLSETNTIEINNNGGNAIHEQVITKEVYDQLFSVGSDLEELKEEGYEIIFFEEDGEDYVKATKKYNFKSLKELERYFQELATSDEGSNSEKFFKSFSLEKKSGKIILSGEIGSPDASAVYTSCKMVLKFDNKISKYDIGKKVDDKTLEIDMMNLWENKAGEEFTIEANGSDLVFWLILGGIVVVLIIGLAIIFYKKRIKI